MRHLAQGGDAGRPQLAKAPQSSEEALQKASRFQSLQPTRCTWRREGMPGGMSCLHSASASMCSVLRHCTGSTSVRPTLKRKYATVSLSKVLSVQSLA